jgi:adenine-specific DNA-methyltransferase
MTAKDNQEPEKLDLASQDILVEKRAELLRLFPEAKTEGGKIDFGELQRALGETVDPGKERYGLNWPGKAECFKTIQTPSFATLRPVPEESVNFGSTENLIIEGDNLEVLKLLQKSYIGKVKMIYIDPPYNTGKDFIYPDNFAESLHTYLEYTGQVDAEGRKFATNTEADGRFHSKWLNMMYPRLYLARNLLRNDGIIFVSIDDEEVSNLRALMNEIFGEENFCAAFVWSTEGHTDNQYKIKVKHEYVLSYYRDATESDAAIGRVVDPNTREESNLWKGLADNNVNKNSPENPPSITTLPVGFPCSEKTLFYKAKNVDDAFFEKTRREKYISDPLREKYQIESRSGLPIKLDDLCVEDHKLTKPCRVYGGLANKNKLMQFIANNCETILDEGLPLRFYINANAAIRYQKENERPRNILSVLSNFGTTEKMKSDLRRMGIPYDYPKPIRLLEHLIKIGCEPDDGIVLDFFAGSGTIGEAVMSVNAADKGRRKFVMVQLPEPLDPSDLSQKVGSDFCDGIGKPRNISEIVKERIRRVVKKLDAEVDGKLDLRGDEARERGFDVFSLAESNFKAWQADAAKDADALGNQLSLHIDHLRDGRTAADFLYEILLKSGFPLTAPVEKVKLTGKEVFSIAGGALFVCLEKELTLDLIRAIAEKKPERVVCLDSGFVGNDQLKTNAVQTFKTKGVVFRTV